MRSLLLLTVALLLASPVVAQDVAALPPLEAQVQSGVRFLSGGLGEGERDRLRALDDDYNVRVALTNAEGAYLHAVDVVVEGKDGRKLVETTTRGPIFLAQLDPGRYLLRASAEGRTTERRVIDVSPERDQTRLYVALVDAE